MSGGVCRVSVMNTSANQTITQASVTQAPITQAPIQPTAGPSSETPLSPCHPHDTDLVQGSDGRWRPGWAQGSELLRDYFDYEWGAPVDSEAGLYERIVLESFQAGLSWATVLRKREAFRARFADFDPDAVAAFGEGEIEHLLGCADIIRNKAKINAAITNARATVALRERGGLANFLAQFQPEDHEQPATLAATPSGSEEAKAMAKALRAEGFRFVGPTTCYSLMQATGMVNDRPVHASPLLPTKDQESGRGNGKGAA